MEDKTEVVLEFLRKRNRSYSAFAEYYQGVPLRISLDKSFQFLFEELNPFGHAMLKNGDSMLNGRLDRVARYSSAYLQFQDLIDLSFSVGDDVKRAKEFIYNRGYFYYESLLFLRSSILAAINTNLLSALTTLRPFVELSVFFLSYRYMAESKGLQKLYDWINGDKGKSPYSSALDYIEENQTRSVPKLESEVRASIQRLRILYNRLSSYSHTPRLSESTGGWVGGFGPGDMDSIGFVPECIEEAIDALVPLMAIARPMILFPVDEREKFGFNGIVGGYSDNCNFMFLEAVFDSVMIEKFREALKDTEEVQSRMDFFQGLKSLSEKEIIESYDVENDSEREAKKSGDINTLAGLHKVKMRALSWAMNYVNYKDVARAE